MAKLANRKRRRLGCSKKTIAACRQIYCTKSSSSSYDSDDEHLTVKSFFLESEGYKGRPDSEENPLLDVDLNPINYNKIGKVVQRAKRLRNIYFKDCKIVPSPCNSESNDDSLSLFPGLPPIPPPPPKAPPPTPRSSTPKYVKVPTNRKTTNRLHNYQERYFENTQTSLQRILQKLNYRSSFAIAQEEERIKNRLKEQNKVLKSALTRAEIMVMNEARKKAEKLISEAQTSHRIEPVILRIKTCTEENRSTKVKAMKHVDKPENKPLQNGNNEKGVPIYCQMRAMARMKKQEATKQLKKQTASGESPSKGGSALVSGQAASLKLIKTSVSKDQSAKETFGKMETGFLPPIITEKRSAPVRKPVASDAETRTLPVLVDKKASGDAGKKCPASGRGIRPRSRKKDSDHKLPPLQVSRKPRVPQSAAKRPGDVVPRLPVINEDKPCQDTSILLSSLAYAKQPTLFAIKKIFFY